MREVRVSLDPAVVGEILAEGTATPPPELPARGLAVSQVELPLLDAVSRLVTLLDSPQDIGQLSPLVLREITYRLLTSPQGARLRQIASPGAPAQRISRAIRWLKDHFAEPLRIDALAKHVRMSPSARRVKTGKAFYLPMNRMVHMQPLEREGRRMSVLPETVRRRRLMRPMLTDVRNNRAVNTGVPTASLTRTALGGAAPVPSARAGSHTGLPVMYPIPDGEADIIQSIGERPNRRADDQQQL